MALLRPIFMQPATGDPDLAYSGIVLRSMFANLAPNEGVAAGGSLLVHQRAAGANMTVEVDAGSAMIRGDDVANQGMYSVQSDAVESLTVPAAPASGSRSHRVIAQVQDKLHNAGFTGYTWALRLLEDTGTGTPAEPASAITLATVAVAAGQASVTDADITDLRSYQPLPRTNVTGINVGYTTIVVTANVVSTAVISGLTTPGTNFIVMALSGSTVPGERVEEVSASNVTATGFDLHIYRNNNVNTAVAWMHIGYV